MKHLSQLTNDLYKTIEHIRGGVEQGCNNTVNRHSPPEMPYGFVRIFIYFFFRRQGFRMIIFDRQAGPFQNFNRSQVMVIGRSVSFSDPARPRVGAWGAPNTQKSPPPQLCVRLRTPGTFLRRKKNLEIFRLPPPPHFFGVLRPHEHFLAIFFFSY